MAETTVIHEKFFTFGTRKYFTPASAPGLVTEYTAIMTDKTISIGIMILDTLSIPFCTPANIMISVNAQNATKHSSVDTPFDMKSVKYPFSASSFAFPLKYSTRYLMTQPPITE